MDRLTRVRINHTLETHLTEELAVDDRRADAGRRIGAANEGLFGPVEYVVVLVIGSSYTRGYGVVG